MRSPEPESTRPIRNLMRRLIKAPAALAILWPAILIVGGYVAWHRWGSVHVAKNYCGIEPTSIQVSDPPAYIRTNVVTTVYRDTAMEGLSLLDRHATAKIAAAFSMHPWVRNVVSVRKLPGGMVKVRLEYRRPVAMVQVFKPGGNDKVKYYFPVDGDGVLLPTSEFSRAETRQFIHIEVPGVYSTNAVGTPFGDSRVEAASKLAEVLTPFQEQAHILGIGVYGDPRQVPVPQLELTTTSGGRLFWGSPPGEELPGEPTVEMKLRTLLSMGGDQNADLRMASPARQPIR